MILGILLAIIGGLVSYFAPDIIGEAGYWVMVIGIIVAIIWVVLLVIHTVKSGS